MPRLLFSVLLGGPLLLLGAGLWVQVPQGTAPPTGQEGVYAEHPPLGHTGGFGEPTCQACHFGAEVNAGEGTLAIEGLPSTVQRGHSYEVVVTLSAPMERSGFMMAVRRPDGTQAGRLTPNDTGRVAVDTAETSDVQYAHHTLEGTTLTAEDRATWQMQWTAPDASVDSVVVHAAANGANDDASEFGDNVYTTEQRAMIEE